MSRRDHQWLRPAMFQLAIGVFLLVVVAVGPTLWDRIAVAVAAVAGVAFMVRAYVMGRRGRVLSSQPVEETP
jgi:hypothetical protein